MTIPTITSCAPGDLGAALAQHGHSDLIVGLFGDTAGVHGGRGAAAVCTLLGLDLGALTIAAAGFDGKLGSHARALVPGPAGPVPVKLVGLGEQASRTALFEAALAAGTAGGVISTLALELPGALGAVAQGHAIGGWRYRRDSHPVPPSPVLLLDDDAATERSDAALHRAAIVARATGWVRQLVETPPNMLRPNDFADSIAEFAIELAAGAVQVERWGVADLQQRGFGGTLAVGAASHSEPVAVTLHIDGDGPLTALAGKGITFDSGGINLKRSASELSWMKSDMAAAASVAAAVVAAAALGTPGPVTALLPIAENMPGGGGMRPGDVLTHPGGRTTEVLDTDSEGRIVLADAVSYLAALRPSHLIDVGTLTDSGGVGHRFWGCWATSNELARAVVSAGERACDPGWVLPLHDSYPALLASRVADIANSPTTIPDSGQLAATYLRTFVGDTAWVHIDNGSAAWLEDDAFPWPAGPTGTPVRALIEFLSVTPNAG